MLTSDRLRAILKALATYYTLTRVQIQSLLGLSGNNADRACRKLLLRLLQSGLVNKTNGEVVFPERNGAPAPTYYPSRKGLEYLAAECADDKWLAVCCLTPNWQYLHHWTHVAEFHIRLDRAISLQSDVQLLGWIGEWDVANPNEKDAAKRYRLFTEIQKTPRLVFAPDAAFLLSYKGYRKVYYLELSRGTSSIQQIAASKTPGVAALSERKLHKRHFPETNLDSFSMIAVEPSPGRRDLLRKSIAARPGAALWKFVSWTDIEPEKFLFKPIFYDIEGCCSPLVKRS